MSSVLPKSLTYDIAYKSHELSAWALLGGRCSRCERKGWIDRT
jgi:hypothetical protein